MLCSCPGGRWSWSPAGFRPCKHVQEAVKVLGVQLVAGHFAAQVLSAGKAVA
jgi:hypothetical protein